MKDYTCNRPKIGMILLRREDNTSLSGATAQVVYVDNNNYYEIYYPWPIGRYQTYTVMDNFNKIFTVIVRP